MKTFSYDAFVIRAGRIIDPFSDRDEVGDLAVVDGVIVADSPANARVLDAEGWIVCPGLMDLHVHLREPGQSHKETIETGTAAAVAGGFTYVACMPNTAPPIDNVDTVRWVVERSRHTAHCGVGPVAAITRGRRGTELTDFPALRDAGAVAFSDDGDGVEDDAVMRAAFELAAEAGVVLIQHCEFRSLSAGGVMHKGPLADRLALPGIDPAAEEAMLERDLALCRETGARYHVAHISTARAVELVRQAKRDGVPVTAEVTPHHLSLTVDACSDCDPNTKMHPPLRPATDVEACRQGLVDGTIDCIATDHAPHTAAEKAVGFVAALPGIIGLETAVGVAAHAMITSDLADWLSLVGWFTAGPAAVLGIDREAAGAGYSADLTVIAPDIPWKVDPAGFSSQGRNTPFAGWELRGCPVATIQGRRIMASAAGLDRWS